MSVADSALGIEIGTHYIKVVRLAHRPRGVRLLSADILRLPKDRANLVEVVHRFFESKDLLSHPCALCTPMFFSMLHTIEVPEDDPRTEEEIVLVERERLDDISEEEMVYDSISLPTDSTHRTILMAMARDAAVQRLLHVPDSIGLNVTRIVPAAVAIFNASLPADLGHSDAIMCAHIGQTVTHVAIGTRHGILFARHFDIGGARFTASLAEGMGISTREAEDIKIRYGFSVGEEKADPTATTALEEIADAWMAELMSTLEFYRERFPDKEAPMRLVLSGGGAEL
ncbi:MAG: pilus assembly protein PilM, partial [Planctomycetes bacterium]|nr:pilus assembly protein PilM [Planctomycetota bacterium]